MEKTFEFADGCSAQFYDGGVYLSAPAFGSALSISPEHAKQFADFFTAISQPKEPVSAPVATAVIDHWASEVVGQEKRLKTLELVVSNHTQANSHVITRLDAVERDHHEGCQSWSEAQDARIETLERSREMRILEHVNLRDRINALEARLDTIMSDVHGIQEWSDNVEAWGNNQDDRIDSLEASVASHEEALAQHQGLGIPREVSAEEEVAEQPKPEFTEADIVPGFQFRDAKDEAMKLMAVEDNGRYRVLQMSSHGLYAGSHSKVELLYVLQGGGYRKGWSE
jgi:hypothetical protein